MTYFKKIIKNFQNDQDGAVAIIVAVALVAILFGVLSLSIDLNRTQTSYTHNYNATDAAALAGAEMWLNAKIDAIGKQEDPLEFRPSDDSMTEFAKNVVIENFSQDQGSSIFLENSSFSVVMTEERVGSGKTRYAVEVNACAQLNTPVANVPEHTQDTENPGVAKTCTTSTAAFDLGTLENVEVAFALDFTESMYWEGINQGCPPGGGNVDCPFIENTKAYELQQAMDYVFENYFDASTNGTAFASIVPYTAFVNTWPYDNNGVVRQSGANERINLDGKYFADPSPSVEDDAWLDYSPIAMTKTTGPDLRSYEIDSRYSTGRWRPFYTYSDYPDETYETENYTYILNRIPAILDAAELESVIDNPDNTSFLPFANYNDAVEVMREETLVFAPELSSITTGFDEPNKQLAEMVCYQYTIAAAADERIDGALIANTFSSARTGPGRDIELHEAFPIQPLTNDPDVLNNVLERYVANTRLNTGNTYPEDSIADFQSERIDKARLMSIYHNTSSIHGLMWAWFTLNNAWQDIWDERSLYENYVGGSASPRNGAAGDVLPSEENEKHIILISDGFDNDGCEDVSGGTASSAVNQSLGRVNSCDAYALADSINDTQYNDMCNAIKTGDPDDSNDDTIIHIITLDFDANQTGASDAFCTKSGGEENRFNQCVTAGEYYNNISPSELENIFDNIFAGILTNAVPVRLIK